MNGSSAFPKSRQPLPPEYQEVYAQYELKNRTGATPATSLSSRMEAWMHRQVAADLANSKGNCVTLEIGAGTLNQLAYEPTSAPYDAVEPEARLYSGSPHLKRIRKFYGSIFEIPAVASYDRITSIAVLEHVCDLPDLLEHCKKLLKPKGQLRIAIPSHGRFLWTLGWRGTTGLEFWLKHKLNYARIMAYEHVNTSDEIESELRARFRVVEHHKMGLSRSLSFYQYFTCVLE